MSHLQVLAQVASSFARVAVLACSTLTGCASDPADTGAGGADGTGGADASGSTTTGAGGTECNTLENLAEPYPEVDVPEVPPAPSGGTIADGLYFLTVETNYTGPGGSLGTREEEEGRTTIEIAGSTWQRVNQSDGSPTTPLYRSTWTVATTGTTLQATIACDEDASAVGSVRDYFYSATGSELMLRTAFDGQPSETVQTFVRQ